MNTKDHETHSESGFTLVELMIATTVFSLVLLIASIALIQIGRVYYKGVTSSNTQTIARASLDNISQSIQFDGGTVTSPGNIAQGSAGCFLTGNTRYRFVIDKQLSSNPSGTQTKHALVQDNVNDCSASFNPDPTTWSGRELLSENMRLAKLQVTPVSGTTLWQVDIMVISGDDGLLDNNASSPTYHQACISGAGGQFCSVSELNTVVEKRI